MDKLQKRNLQFDNWKMENESVFQNINQIDQAIISNTNLLDRNLLIISSSAIALSVPLLGELSSFDISSFTKIILILAWSFFGLTIILTLYSFNMSTQGLIKLKRETEAIILSSKKFHLSKEVFDDELLINRVNMNLQMYENIDTKKISRNDISLNYINHFTLYSFIAGIITLSIFLANFLLNIHGS